jgi:DNA-binding transcriptional LysR family regulator
MMNLKRDVMNLKIIKTFMMVVDYKSFSAVATIQDISQPAVSKQVKSLEKELGVPLLHRETCEPTEAGRLVYHQGERFMASWEGLVEECRRYQGELTGVLHIGASSIPGTYFVPAILRKFIDVYPRMEVKLSVMESDEVLEHVKEGKFDVGFVGSQPKSDQLTSRMITKDKLFVIGPIDSEEIADIEEIKEHPFIFRSDRSGTWKAVEKGLNERGISAGELKCVAKVQNTESVISMVEAGLGFSIVSDIAAKKAVKHGRIKMLVELPVEREFFAVYLTSKQQNQILSTLVDYLEI